MSKIYKNQSEIDHLPLVSCIMPTYNRRGFLSQAVKYFREQSYPNKELIIIDDGSDPIDDLVPQDGQIKYIRLKKRLSIGSKRNLAIAASTAEIILHWDDDDWHARHRIHYQVEQLLKNNAEVCGIHKVLFFDLRTQHLWLYEYPLQRKMWLAGGSLCYRKTLWEKNNFPDVNIGEDTRFLWQRRLENALPLPDFKFFVAMIHPGNTSRKRLSPPYWKSWQEDDLQDLVNKDWPFYAGLNSQPAAHSGLQVVTR